MMWQRLFSNLQQDLKVYLERLEDVYDYPAASEHQPADGEADAREILCISTGRG